MENTFVLASFSGGRKGMRLTESRGCAVDLEDKGPRLVFCSVFMILIPHCHSSHFYKAGYLANDKSMWYKYSVLCTWLVTQGNYPHPSLTLTRLITYTDNYYILDYLVVAVRIHSCHSNQF